MFRNAAEDPTLAFSRYERLKREFQRTDEQCEAAGFKFVPLVVEAHSGGWSGSARGCLGWLSQQVAAVSNSDPDGVALRMAQRISITLHRENARAILRRSAEVGDASVRSAWEQPQVDEW